MQVAMRRLIIIGAISIGGAAVGLALGNFAAGGSKRTGAQELAGYSHLFGSGDNAAVAAEATMDPGFAERSGPSSYNCQGCDAHLHNDMMPRDASAADTRPLPPYRPEDGAPAARASAAQPSGLLAVPALPPVLAADRAKPTLQPPVPPASDH